jgi:hypothetical protein
VEAGPDAASDEEARRSTDERDPLPPFIGAGAAGGTALVTVVLGAIAGGAVFAYGLSEATAYPPDAPFVVGTVLPLLVGCAVAPGLATVVGDLVTGWSSSLAWIYASSLGAGLAVGLTALGSFALATSLLEGVPVVSGLFTTTATVLCIATPLAFAAGAAAAWWATAEEHAASGAFGAQPSRRRFDPPRKRWDRMAY